MGYGDPNNLEDYKGGRDFDSLKKFADENLGPSCGPANLDLCDAEKKAQIEKFMAMDQADLAKQVKEKTEESEKLEADFKEFLTGLQKEYEAASKKKDEAVKAIKDKGLSTM